MTSCKNKTELSWSYHKELATSDARDWKVGKKGKREKWILTEESESLSLRVVIRQNRKTGKKKSQFFWWKISFGEHSSGNIINNWKYLTGVGPKI